MPNKRRRIRNQPGPDTADKPKYFFKGLVLSLLLLMMVATFAVTCRSKYFNPVVSAYEGEIVDKWIGTTNSETGSAPYYRLLIDQGTGGRITVPIDYEAYMKANIGMWIHAHDGKIELSARRGASPAVFQIR